MSGRLRLRAAACVGVVASMVSAGLSSSVEAASTSVVPNAAIGTSTAGWSTGSNATLTPVAASSVGPAVPGDADTELVPDRRGLAVQAKKARSGQRVTVVSSTAGKAVGKGTHVRVAGPVRVSRAGVRVTLTVREVAPSGAVKQTKTFSRTSRDTSWRFVSATLVTRYAGSHIRVAVDTVASDRPITTLGGFFVSSGSSAFPAPLVGLPNGARTWVDAHPSDPRAARIGSAIASRPVALWLLGEEVHWRANLEALVTKTERTNGTSTIVLYHVPKRYDGLAVPGGAPSLTAYKTFVDEVFDRIGSARVNVVVEPDGLWFHEIIRQDIEHGDGTYSQADLDTRIEAIRYAASKLSALPATRVYVEAGTSSGSVAAGDMAAALRKVGASATIGFAVNVSSYSPEASIARYAGDIRTSLQTRGVANPRFVVDTGRNGDPLWTGHDTVEDDKPWCNWSGQLLGTFPVRHAPSSAPARAGRDQDLWVKGPGESDGECRPGDPAGGQLMPDVAYRMSEGRG